MRLKKTGLLENLPYNKNLEVGRNGSVGKYNTEYCVEQHRKIECLYIVNTQKGKGDYSFTVSKYFIKVWLFCK